MDPGFAASEIDTSKPHPARMYDAYLDGRDNYPVDREAVRQVLRDFPEVRAIARANRAFLQRAVRFLAGQAGIRQFLDIGTGIPSAGNVHEVAGQVAPDSRVVYVDNDPIVHVHANALLTGTGSTSIVLADLRDPESILAHPKVRSLIDFSQPVALLLIAILHFISDRGGSRRDRRHAAGRTPAGKLPRLVARDGGLPPARWRGPGRHRLQERDGSAGTPDPRADIELLRWLGSR